MAKELYGNSSSQSFLSADITSTATSLTVLGGSWPSGGQFTIVIDGEVMLVTAVSGTGPYTFTVTRAQEGTTGAIHNAYAFVFSSLTDASLRRLVRVSIGGTFQAARRELNFIGSGVTVSAADDSTNDKLDITLTASGGGGGISGGFYPALTAPPSTGWTILAPTTGSQTASITTDSTGVNIIDTGPTSGVTENVRMAYRTMPSTPCTITAVILATAPFGATAGNFGLMVRESGTGKLQALGILIAPTSIPAVNTWCWSNANTYASSNPSTGNAGFAPVFLRITYDATNIIFGYSGDGVNFRTFYTQSKTFYFTTAPDQIGFYLNTASGAGASAARLIHWVVT